LVVIARLIDCSISASHDTSSYFSAGQHDHGSRCCHEARWAGPTLLSLFRKGDVSHQAWWHIL
jgi:hypothetical protein